MAYYRTHSSHIAGDAGVNTYPTASYIKAQHIQYVQTPYWVLTINNYVTAIWV